MVDISQQGIDSEGYVPESYELLPAGKYVMAATSSEGKDTNDGTGQYVSFEFQITEDGPHLGRKLWKIFMVSSTSKPKGVEMGLKGLTELAAACGIRSPGDTEEMHGIEVVGHVRVKKPTPKDIKAGYDQTKNEIRGFSPADADEAAAPAAAPAADDAQPWKQ